MTWLERQPAGNVDKNWTGTACTPDGQIIYVCNSNGKVYKSVDVGASWSDISPSTSDSWQDICCSTDGVHIMLVGEHYIRRSHDVGASWSYSDTGYSPEKACCWGNTYSYYVSSSGCVARFANSSQTLWYCNGQGDYRCIACNSTGEKVITARYGERVWRSTDHGESWTETRPCGDVNKNWLCIGCSSDFGAILIGTYGGRLYASYDEGLNWIEEQPGGAVDLNWRIAEVSGDGSVRMAGIYSGRLYTSG